MRLYPTFALPQQHAELLRTLQQRDIIAAQGELCERRRDGTLPPLCMQLSVTM